MPIWVVGAAAAVAGILVGYWMRNASAKAQCATFEALAAEREKRAGELTREVDALRASVAARIDEASRSAATVAELNALSAYLGSLQPMNPPPDLHPDGKTVYQQNCSMCHLARPDDHLFTDMPKDPQTAIAALGSLPAMFPIMPDLKLSEDERRALVQWVNTQRPAQAAKGGN